MVESIGASLGSGSQQLQQAGLGQEDFLKILLTQLTYQDPMKPLDNQEFIAQFAQFSSLDQTRQSNENLDSLLLMQMADQGIGLLKCLMPLKYRLRLPLIFPHRLSR